jgi:dienelactone hydrolase
MTQPEQHRALADPDGAVRPLPAEPAGPADVLDPTAVAAASTAPLPADAPEPGERTPDWQRRFLAVTVDVPSWAPDAPDRFLYTSDASGVKQQWTWDRATDTHRMITDRPAGTPSAVLDRRGEWVWWFDDADGDEEGVWRRTPFEGGEPVRALPFVPPGRNAGLAIGPAEVLVAWLDGSGGQVVLVRGDTRTTLYQGALAAAVGGLTADGRIAVLLVHPDQDPGSVVLRAVDGEGREVGELTGGPHTSLQCEGLVPVPGRSTVLVKHSAGGSPGLLLWEPETGGVTEVALDLPGPVRAGWYPDGDRLLLLHAVPAGTELWSCAPDGSDLRRLETPPGTIGSARVRPDGVVEFLWSSAVQPPTVSATSGPVAVRPPGDPAPPGRPVERVRVPGPGGEIPVLVSRPEGGAAPYPAVFLLHGGPMSADSDTYSPRRSAWTDAGAVVIQVNYRGSTNNGPQWQAAIAGRPGITEMEDVAAVREWAVRTGLVAEGCCVLSGASWGGFLTLLGLGLQPGDWAAGLARYPVADTIAAYGLEIEEVRQVDRALFGGSPDEVPEVYARASPMTYAAAVRSPVFVTAADNDPRCPPQQLAAFLAVLDQHGVPTKLHRTNLGHGTRTAQERIDQLQQELDFCHSHVGF